MPFDDTLPARFRWQAHPVRDCTPPPPALFYPVIFLAEYLHRLNPVLLRLTDSIQLRWYGIAYVMGFIAGYWLLVRWARKGVGELKESEVADFITYAALFGVLLGRALRHLVDEGHRRLRDVQRHTQRERQTDEQAARQIREDGIDVLIDLKGHTVNGRLGIFAYRPAPVQASWLGYFATTGVEQMDYFIADPSIAPPSEDAHFTETLWRLPQTVWSLTAPRDEIAVAPLPAATGGAVQPGVLSV